MRYFSSKKFWLPPYLMLVTEQDLDLLEGDCCLLPLDLQIISCICCLIRSIATTLPAPLGIMTSAYFLVGRQNSSKAGLTSVVYWCSTWARSLPRSSISLNTRLASLVSGSVSTNNLMLNISLMLGK